MTADLDRILSEFMDEWNAGRRPRVRDYLERVPDDQQRELADRLTTLMSFAPTPVYDDATWNQIRSEPLVDEGVRAIDDPAGLWPALLPRLRERSRMSIAQLAGALTQALGIEGREEKTARYLGEMEQGRLEPSGVSRRVLEALASILGLRESDLEAAGDLGYRPRPAAAFFRADEGVADEVGQHLEVLAEAMAAPSERDWDEVDELFRGGR